MKKDKKKSSDTKMIFLYLLACALGRPTLEPVMHFGASLLPRHNSLNLPFPQGFLSTDCFFRLDSVCFGRLCLFFCLSVCLSVSFSLIHSHCMCFSMFMSMFMPTFMSMFMSITVCLSDYLSLYISLTHTFSLSVSFYV